MFQTTRKVDLIKEANRLYIPLKVRINDSLLIDGRFQLDFGAGGTLHLQVQQLKNLGFLKMSVQKHPILPSMVVLAENRQAMFSGQNHLK